MAILIDTSILGRLATPPQLGAQINNKRQYLFCPSQETPVQLRFESGKVIHNVRASDIRKNLEGEEFTILLSDEDDLTFIQCAEENDEPGHYILDYQEGSTYEHYRAEESIPLERVLAAFYKYLRDDESWRSDFEWEHMPL